MKSVSYKGLELLQTGEPLLNKGDNVSICLYIINYFENPFIEILFYNNDDTLEFLKYKYDDNIPSKSGHNILKNIFTEYDNDIRYRGYIDNVLFYEMTFDDYYVRYMTNKDKLWLLLIHDIINVKKILHMYVDNNVINFFLNNDSLLFLHDKNKNIIEMPISCYYGNHFNKIQAISVYGVNKGDIHETKGPFYYYSDYNTALRYAVWNNDKKQSNHRITDKNGKYKKGGIVKFALFLGKTTIHKEDDVNWVKKYDSVMYYESKSIRYVLNKYINQYPLYYFSINTHDINSIEDLYLIKIE